MQVVRSCGSASGDHGGDGTASCTHHPALSGKGLWEVMVAVSMDSGRA